MKVIICSCARCTAHGNEYLFDSANVVKTDVEYAYEVEGFDNPPQIEIEYKNIKKEVEDYEKKSPLVKIDDTYITKATPEVLMEKMYEILSVEWENLKGGSK